MLVDLVPIATPFVAALTSLEMPSLGQFGAPLLVAGLFTLAASLFFRTRKEGSLGARVIAGAFANWRLALLGSSGVILSIASGWTTWDGMRNFTQEPILSFMVTFGIQGVMLIVAWLIGESFATGMTQRPMQQQAGGSSGWLRTTTIALITGLTIVVAALWLDRAVANLPDMLLYGATALLLTAVVGALLVSIMTADVKETFVASLRAMVKNVVLWVMFLACMATSVFFSFDSLFSTIFPKDERARAAELRAQNQVAGVVNDIVALAVKRRIEEADRLFETPAWKSYDKQLDAVISLANEAPAMIRAEITRELEEKRQRVAGLEEKRANATSSQAALQARKGQLTTEIARLTTERPEPAAALAQQKTVVTEIERRLDEHRAKTLAEEKGVEGSGKVGRGRFWREARGDEAKTQAELDVAKTRLKAHEDRLNGIDRRVSLATAELAQIDGDLAKLKGEAATATQLIDVAETAAGGEKGLAFDPAAGVRILEKARQTFRQEPRQDSMATLQTQCSALQSAGNRVASLKASAGRIDCDPGQASEAAARVFALNVGIERLSKSCVGGDKLPQSGGADALFQFARSCVQDSGLPAADTEQLRTSINFIELNRDDRAHRFVVTWNAFQDGNRLAYLALAIAIAIDSLVFMSGLFGATVVRSPLSDVPSHKGRSASHLEAIVENALLPDKFENAMLTLEAIHPMSGADQRRMGNGWTHEVILPPDHTAHRGRVIKVLNAGAVIGAVERDEVHTNRFLVRSELFEFLATVAKKAFDADKDHARLAELKKLLVVSLTPDPGHYADVVLSHLHPMTPHEDFTQEIRLGEIMDGERYIVQQALNAGSTLGYVSRLKGDRPQAPTFIAKSAFYRTLAIISADYPRTGQIRPLARLGGPAAGPRDGGALITDGVPSLPRATSVTHQIANQSPHSIVSHDPTYATSPPATAETSEQRDHRLKHMFREQLLNAIGIDPHFYDSLVGAPWGAAVGAVQAFTPLLNRNTQLAEWFHDADDRARAKFDDTYDHLRRTISTEQPHVALLLSDVGRELDQNWAVLMIMPDGPYDCMLHHVADALETQSGEGNLSREEQGLHRQVKLLRDAVATNKRNNVEAWNSVTNSLNKLSPESSR